MFLNFRDWHKYGGKEPSLITSADLFSYIENSINLNGDQDWLTICRLDGNVETLSRAALLIRAAQMAEWLRDIHDIQAGQVLAIMPRNDLISVIALFGALWAGVKTFFLNPGETPARLNVLMSTLPVEIVLGKPNTKITSLSPIDFPSLEILDSYTPSAPRKTLKGDGVFLFPTSGSTADSKIVQQSLYNLMSNAQAITRHHGLSPNIKLMSSLPIFHVNGLHFMLMSTLLSGAQSVLLERFDVAQFQGLLLAHKPDIANVVPSILESLLLQYTTLQFPDNFRYFVTAAAPLMQRTVRAVHSRYRQKVTQGYGLTETTNFSCKMPIDLDDSDYERLMLLPETPPVGVAVDGNEIEIFASDGSILGNGEIGEVCMRGHNVMIGYYQNEEENCKAELNGWFRSGDLGFAKTDVKTGHRLFTLTARRKNIAKVMGLAVSLEEIERYLLEHAGIFDAVCFTEPDRFMGERIIAIVTGESANDLAGLRKYLLQYFSIYACPSKFIPVKSIPRTVTGKVRRGDLMKLFSSTGEK